MNKRTKQRKRQQRSTWAMSKSEFNKVDRVYVDFTSESATEFSGSQFAGYGVLDRVEDGRVYGRLDNGLPFTCFEDDVEKVRQGDEMKYELIPSTVESVEGEYVSPADYMDIQLSRTKDLIREQERRVAEAKARMKAEQVRMQKEALVASLAMRWWR